MPSKTMCARMLNLPSDHSLAGGRFDSLQVQARGQGTDLVLDYQELSLSAPATLQELNGRPVERVRGVHMPCRIRFAGAAIQRREGLFSDPSSHAPDNPGRGITSALHWRNPEGERYHLVSLRSDDPSVLLLTSLRVEIESRSGPDRPVSSTRDLSPVPESPVRLVPNPRRMRALYGGDPVSICLNGRNLHQRLFIRGVDVQENRRPDVQAVLNLGEDPSKWATHGELHPDDRWSNKGEGRQGMRVADIVAESEWVVERLSAGQRVLVHCSAGMNRSATVCCGALILLEGLSAEAALGRVRQRHPWARPDPFHWINLRWLAHIIAGKMIPNRAHHF